MARNRVRIIRLVLLTSLLAQLVAGCGGGSSGDESGALEPSGNVAPVAVITASQTSGVSPIAISLDASASSDPDGSIANYQWDFGDGVTAKGQIVSHIFDAGAEKNLEARVTLTVTDNLGAQATSTQLISIQKNAPPVAVITYSKFSINRKVYFKGTDSVDPEGGAVLYAWDFGDGNASNMASPTHEYADNGQYRVRLVVDDQTGRKAETSVLVDVSNGRFTISGSLASVSQLFVDGDTNDQASNYVPNNNLDQPQSLASPAAVVGFLSDSALGRGKSGDNRFSATADPYDVYVVALRKGQRILLHTLDWAVGQNDLDLTLLDTSGNIVDYSWSVGGNEELIVAEAGEYYLVAGAYSGSSLYSLQIYEPQAASYAVPSGFNGRDEFVVGEVLAQPKSTLRSAGAAGISAAGVAVDRAGIQRIRLATSGVARSKSASPLRIEQDLGVRATVAQRARLQTIAEVKRLQASGNYDLVDLNHIRYPTSFNDPLLGQLWHYEQLGVPTAWARATGEGVVVSVIDSGIVSAHEDLSTQLVPGYDFVSDPASALDADGIDPNPEDPSSRHDWHGTHVAGTVAAAAGNGKGIAGIAHGARIMPLRVVGQYGATTYDIIQAIRYASGLANDSGTLPAQRADVINLSLGGRGYSTAEQAAIDAARAAGVIIVAAAGNDASNANNYWPAGLNGVVTVAASNRNGEPAPYSNFGSSVDIAAPGGSIHGLYADPGILSTVGVAGGQGAAGSGYDYFEGTSMAAPHVSGAVALMKQLAPDMTPAQFDQLLMDYDLTDGPGLWNQNLGYGLLNVERALDAAVSLAGGEVRERLYLEHGRQLNLWHGKQAEIRVLASSTSVSVASVSVSEPWLSVSYQGGNPSGVGGYLITVDRAQLPPGQHHSQVSFVASSGTSVDLQVFVSVAQAPSEDARYSGAVYVALIDVLTGAVDQVIPAIYDAETGRYSYRSGSLYTHEQFYLRAGTDNDNDGILCEPGELCAGLIDGGGEAAVGAGEFGESAVEDLLLELQGGSSPFGSLKRR